MLTTVNCTNSIPADCSVPIRILLVEDHEIIRLGIVALVGSHNEFRLVGEVANFQQALRMAEQCRPDIILLDLHLEDGLIVDRIPELLENHLERKVLVITATLDSDLHCLALRKGASGVIMKSECEEAFVRAIHSVQNGDLWIDPQTAENLFNDYWR